MSGGFRGDVQGMRALAVVLVVLYHARIPGLSGGFVGVDVFFVISGYVIAASLRRELDRTGRISLRAFYGRRARRLFPAFVAVTIPTLVVANLLLPIGPAQEAAAATAIAAAFSVANLQLLSRHAGYFDPGDAANPFLHTWSLGVEEQFYVIGPLLLIALVSAASRTRWSRAALVRTVMLIGGLASLTLAVFLVAIGQQQSAFYHPVARFWEIGAGVAVASWWSGRPLRRNIAVAVASAGGAAILVATIAYDSSTAFPGAAALLPTLGTVGLLVAVPSVPALRRTLSCAPMRWIGDRSYGWYLWHWPAIVFTGQMLSSSPAALAAASLVALGPTALSYRYLEQPIRDRERTPGGWRLGVAFAAAATFVIGSGVAAAAGAASRWGLAAADLIEHDGVAYQRECFGPPGADRCTFEPAGLSRGEVLLVGDSHALSIADGVVDAARELDLTVVVVAICPIPIGLRYQQPTCDTFGEQVVDVARRRQPDLVLVAQRSTKYVHTGVVAPNGEDEPFLDERGVPVTDADVAVAAWRAGLLDFRERLDELGVPLLSIDVVPEFREAFNRNIRVVSPQPTVAELGVHELDERRARVLAVEHAVLAPDHWIDPADVLCSDELCSSVDADGTWLYFDDNHLNVAGALALAPAIRDAIARVLDGSATT